MGGLRLSVSETFLSLQGEGAWVGWPCFFIRLAGCNLRCTYCDTRYAYNKGEKRDIPGLVEEWRKSRIGLVQVTGGEPLLQAETLTLLEALLNEGAKVLLETNGSLALGNVPMEVIKIVDRKTPGSGMEKFFLEANLGWLNQGDQLKFVITDREDYEWAREEVVRLCLSCYTEVLFSPAWGGPVPFQLAEWIIADRLSVRFQIQLHKILWGEKRGA
ncbi:MAG: 7-carboxy-7-deazaguanine synthase QueE [Thermodesulfobacteriota bacterium]|nr:MAG: 7-carboxy-7-deazaguanine synthase QueE [Thermodesulfobacteriota bacterium]